MQKGWLGISTTSQITTAAMTFRKETGEGSDWTTKRKTTQRRKQVGKTSSASSASDSDVLNITQRLESLTLMVEQLNKEKKVRPATTVNKMDTKLRIARIHVKFAKGRWALRATRFLSVRITCQNEMKSHIS